MRSTYLSLGAWVIVGTITGWPANGLMGKQLKGGCLGQVLVGMLGAVLRGVVFQRLGRAPANGVDAYSILVALVGSVLLLALV